MAILDPENRPTAELTLGDPRKGRYLKSTGFVAGAYSGM
jgi:hypothetical protein